MQLHAPAMNAFQCEIHMCSAISLVVQARDSGRFKIFVMKIHGCFAHKSHVHCVPSHA